MNGIASYTESIEKILFYQTEQKSPFPQGFVDDVLIVVVSQPAGQFLIVHLWLVLAHAPSTGYLNVLID